jgi:peptide/nickel transport system permease protein
MQAKIIESAATDVAAELHDAADVSTAGTMLADPGGAALATAPRGFRLPLWVKILLTNPLAIVGLLLFGMIFFAAVFAPLLTSRDPSAMIGPLGRPPSSANWLGTNNQGQDIFAQILYGARFSMAVGIGTGVAIAALATFIGMIAGYSRGWLDDILTLVMNVFLVIPQLPLLIVIGVYVPLRGNDAFASALMMIVVITITGWAWGGRVMRSQTLTLRSRDFIRASLVSGESTWRIIFVEMLPNMMSLIVNTVILSAMGAILTEAALDYLGVGSVNQITWGTMLYHAQADSVLFSGKWWVFVCPGVAIAMTTMSMIFINNGIDAISNPRLRVARPKRVRNLESSVGGTDPSAHTSSLDVEAAS